MIHGDVTKLADRKTLHLAIMTTRCTLASGFPRQPYSSQGDQLGLQDARARPLHGLLAACWEQQAGAFILENE